MKLDPHPAWMLAGVVYDPRRERTLVFQDDALWAIESGHSARQRRSGPATLETSMREDHSVLKFHSASPNPWTREVAAHFSLPDVAPTTLELLDVSGRLLWR